MSELLPCPFCGYKDVYIERIDLSSCAVICDGCGCRGPQCCPYDDKDVEDDENIYEYQSGASAAVREWNKRASQ